MPKPFQLNVQSFRKETKLLKEGLLPLKVVKVRGEEDSCRNTGAKPVQATLLQRDKNSPCQKLLLSLQSSFTTRFNYSDNLQLRVRTTTQEKYSQKWSAEKKKQKPSCQVGPGGGKLSTITMQNSRSQVDSNVQIDACPR